MKMLIVQGLTIDNISAIDLKNFWKPCMDGVQHWAKKRGWDYKLFTKPINDDFNISTWDQRLIPDREIATQNQFYKFQWMDGWTEYDHVIWLDADCLIYGDPSPFELGKFAHHPAAVSCNFLISRTMLGRWIRPEMSIWGGRQSEVQKAIDWARYQFEHPDDQDPLLRVIRTLNSAPIDNPDDEHFGLDFTEEIFLSAYTHSRIGNGVNLMEQNVGFSGSFGSRGELRADTWQPDTIIHIGGPNKHQKLSKIRAYRAYMAYISKEHPWGDIKKIIDNEMNMVYFIIKIILIFSLCINDTDQLRPRPAGRPKEEEYESTT